MPEDIAAVATGRVVLVGGGPAWSGHRDYLRGDSHPAVT